MAVNPLLIAGGIASLASAIISAKEAKERNKAERAAVEAHNKNLQQQAQSMSHLAVSEGVGQQAAYNWASNMIRKNRTNAAAMESISNIASSKMSDSATKFMQYRAGALDLLSKRLAKPKKLGTWELVSAGFQGALATIGAIASASDLFKKDTEDIDNPTTAPGSGTVSMDTQPRRYYAGYGNLQTRNRYG